jgi:hypothetical protein
VGGRPAVPAAQPDRPGQLGHQEVQLVAGLGGTGGVVAALRLLQVRPQLLDPGLVGGLGLRVQQHAGITKIRTHRQLGFAAPGP